MTNSNKEGATMKSMLKSLMSVAATALALTSCSTDATDEVVLKGELKTLAVNATIDQTRTVMKADDHRILEWSDDDQIHFYIGTDATEANSINPKSGGKITGVTYKEGDKVYAYYSNKEEGTSNGVTGALINISASQKQSEANVFEGTYLPMVAKGTIENGTVNLVFQPVGCVLVFNVYGQVKNAGEKIQSITFETPEGTGCCGYDNCDLTAAELGYKASSSNTSVTVTLDNPAAIGTSKPAANETKTGGDQVYLVVAPVNYPAGSKFIVTTDFKGSDGKNFTYTFETKDGIDCSRNTARVVNLNLAKSEELKPAIKAPTSSLQSYDEGYKYVDGIEFLNITTSELSVENVVSVYSDAGLTQQGVDWLTIHCDNKSEFFANGILQCRLEANTTASDRTAYICIKCADAQAVIAVTQLPEKYFVKVTETPEDMTGKYLIVNESEQHVFNGSISDKNKIWEPNNYFGVTITNQEILLIGETKAALVNISKIESGYLLQAASGLYLYADKDDPETGSAASTNLTDASQYPNSICIEESGFGTHAIIKSSVGLVMCYVKNRNNKPTIKFYNSDTYTERNAIQLYKLQE